MYSCLITTIKRLRLLLIHFEWKFGIDTCHFYVHRNFHPALRIEHFLYLHLLFYIYLDFHPVYPVGIYLLKVNNSEICSKLTIKTPEQCQALLLTLNIFHTLL